MCCTCAILPDQPTTRYRSRARTRLCRRTAREISIRNIGGMRRIQLASRRPANSCVAVLCHKVHPFRRSALKYWYSSDVRFMGFKTCIHTTQTAVFSSSALLSYYWGAPFLQPKFEMAGLWGSNLAYIYYSGHFLRLWDDRFLQSRTFRHILWTWPNFAT